MVSYITRINYGAIIVEMESATGISKSMLSMALTGSFITYGTGQVISGIIGDRVSPKRLVSLGFLITVLMNF
jgi:sugar phosphate permease